MEYMFMRRPRLSSDVVGVKAYKNNMRELGRYADHPQPTWPTPNVR